MILWKAFRWLFFFGWARKKRDSLDLLGISLTDLVSHFFLIGGTGSGKSSLMKIFITDALRRGGETIGVCWSSVKPDEKDAFYAVMKAAGAMDRVIHLKPGEFTFNFAAYVLQQPNGSPAKLTELLLNLNKLLRRSSGEGNDTFWENLFAKMCEFSIILCWLGTRGSDGTIRLTVEDLYKLVTSSPATPEQVSSETFRENSFCCQMVNQAKKNIRGANELRLFEQAVSFWWQEAPALGSKARTAGVSQISSLLTPFLRDPLYTTICSETSSFSPEMAATGSCVLLDAPTMSCGQGGLLFQSLINTLVVEFCLARSNPSHMTLIVRDEVQELIGDIRAETSNMSLSRSTMTGFISASQGIPTLQAALGGNAAEQELHSIFSNYSTKIVLSTGCPKTTEYFSKAWGEYPEEVVSVSETKDREDMTLLDWLSGDDRMVYSVSTQMRPRCPMHWFPALRRGGVINKRMVDFFLWQAGRTYGADGSPFTKLTLKQRSFQ